MLKSSNIRCLSQSQSCPSKQISVCPAPVLQVLHTYESLYRQTCPDIDVCCTTLVQQQTCPQTNFSGHRTVQQWTCQVTDLSVCPNQDSSSHRTVRAQICQSVKPQTCPATDTSHDKPFTHKSQCIIPQTCPEPATVLWQHSRHFLRPVFPWTYQYNDLYSHAKTTKKKQKTGLHHAFLLQVRQSIDLSSNK